MKTPICCSLDIEEVKQLANPDIPDQEAVMIFTAIAHPVRLKILKIEN